MTLDPFVKKSDMIDIEFSLYVDQSIDLFLHAQSGEAIKQSIDNRNKIIEAIMQEREDNLQEMEQDEKENEVKAPESPEEIVKETIEEVRSKIDIEQIKQAQAEGNDSVELLDDDLVRIVFKEENLSDVKLKVKEPSHEEIFQMISASTIVSPVDGALKVDYNRYNDVRIRTLLKSWNFKQDGKVVPVNDKNISALHPKIFSAILFYINLKVDKYLEDLIY